MLDTYGRKYVEPVINKCADIFIKLNRTPNQITKLAFIIGVSSGISIVFKRPYIAVALLWISGLFDAVDGTMARKTGQTSPWGTLMDITFDRLVELSVIIGLGYLYTESRLQLIFVLCATIMSMTVFLTVGALSKNTGKKSFTYQTGLAERTEGFIMSTLMILFPQYLEIIAIVYALMMVITAGQRFFEARKLLK